MPSLIEPGVKYFLKETLKQSRNKKIANSFFWNNISLLCLFLFFLISALVWKKKTKLTKEEKIKNNEKQRSYVLDKIKTLQLEKQKQDNILITNLPEFESNFETMHKKYYKI